MRKCNHYIPLLLLASPLFGACVQVTGTLHLPNTSLYNGTLTISWPVPWIAADGTIMPAGPTIVTTVSKGVVNVCLEATLPANSTNPNNMSYSVTYRPTLTGATPEVWLVPAMGPVDISVVRQPQPAPTPATLVQLSQISTTGAMSGQSICFIGGVLTYGNCGNGLTNPMTTLGDMIYEDSSPGPARLAGSTASTMRVLTQTGTGSASATPAWGQANENALAFTDILTLNSSTMRHGLLPKLSGNSTDCLNGLGVFGACPSANVVSSVFGRIGAIVAVNGDYTVGQVTNAVSLAGTNTGLAAMTLNMAASTSAAALRVPNIAGASSTTAGVVSYDTTNKGIHAGANGVDNLVGLLPSSITPSNNDCAKFTVSGGVITLNTAGASCSGSSPVSSVFGRTGAVTAQSGDYTAAQVTNAVSSIAANTTGASFTLDASAATSAAAIRLPNIAGATSITAGVISYDTTNKNIHAGANGVDNLMGLLPSSIAPANNDCAKFTVVAGVVTLNTAGAACGSGTGSGTVNTGTATHLAYYATSTNAVSDMGADFTFSTHTLSMGASGLLDLSAATSAAAFKVPNIAGASSTTNGAMSYDSTNNNIHVGSNGADNIVGVFPSASIPTTGNCVKWGVAGGVVTLVDQGTTCGGAAPSTPHAITFVINGQGSTPSTGDLNQFPIAEYSCTINRVDVTSDQSGSMTADIWKAASRTIPTSANKISASDPATLSAAQVSTDTTLTGWTTSISAGDTFGATLVTASTITSATVQIWCQ